MPGREGARTKSGVLGAGGAGSARLSRSSCSGVTRTELPSSPAPSRGQPPVAVGADPRRSPSPEPGPPPGCGEGGCGRLLPALRQPPPLRYRPETAAPTRDGGLSLAQSWAGWGPPRSCRAGGWTAVRARGRQVPSAAGRERSPAAPAAGGRRDGGSGTAQPAPRLASLSAGGTRRVGGRGEPRSAAPALPSPRRGLSSRGDARRRTCGFPAAAAQLPVGAEAPRRRRQPGAAGGPAGLRGAPRRRGPGARARGRGAGRSPCGRAPREYRGEQETKVNLYIFFIRIKIPFPKYSAGGMEGWGRVGFISISFTLWHVVLTTSRSGTRARMWHLELRGISSRVLLAGMREGEAELEGVSQNWELPAAAKHVSHWLPFFFICLGGWYC